MMTSRYTAIRSFCRRHCLAHWMLLMFIAAFAWAMWPTQFGGNTSVVVVSGPSMEPTYHSGDVLIVRKKTPVVGDVIVFTVPDRKAQVVHRVIERRSDGTMIVQGDNRSTPDLPLPRDSDVVGVAIQIIPQGWILLRLLTSPLVLGAAAGSYVLAAVIYRHQHPHRGPLPPLPT
jgi:signal peptidase I